MNFFKAQDKAKKKTNRLVFLFLLAVIFLIILTNLLFIGTFAFLGASEDVSFYTVFVKTYDRNNIMIISLGVSLLILLGSLYKAMALSKGGPAIAEMLGGKLIPQSTEAHDERKLLNIVEEMSIAAGMPIPKVYILDEPSINAFAAGQSNSKSVIGITRGALTHLTRDELQGVIAHEFSHILNGDMRLNLRLISILHGILLIGIVGHHLLNSMRYSRGKKDGGGAIIVLGIGLMLIGYAGTFFGNLIKASVSRQREFLADASAVQFTRNKDTIAGALKKIGGLGSVLETPSASEYSHAYFANGVSSFLESMFSTHPPLAERIKQIDPAWNGRFITPKAVVEEEIETSKEKGNPLSGLAATAAVITAAEQLVNQVGSLTQDNIEYAHQQLLAIPNELKIAAQSAFSARAVIYALLLREQKNKREAWELLVKFSDPLMPGLTKELLTKIEDIDELLILPLLELCINALRELSKNQYIRFKNTINEIITADKTVDLNEWILQRLVLQQLDEHFSLRKPAKEKHAYLGAVKNSAEILLSLIAYTEHKDSKEKAEAAFIKGINEIGTKAFKLVTKEDISLNAINASLDQLMQLKPLLKQRILKACATTILSDGNTTRKGLELFRTISTSLNCPVPPLIV